MESRTEPYSLQLYPTCKKLCETLQKADDHQYPFLFPHTDHQNLLDRIKVTVDQFFDLDKIDCNQHDWHSSCVKLKMYIFLKTDDFFATCDLYNYVLQKINSYPKKAYLPCNESCEERFSRYEKSDSDDQIAQTWQIFLNALVQEAKAVEELESWFKKRNDALKTSTFLNQLPTSKEGLPYLQVSPKIYLEAKKIFKRYDPIIFKDPNKQIVCFKEIKSSDVKVYRKNLEDIKLKEKFEGIKKIAVAQLDEVTENYFEVPNVPNYKKLKDIIPFYNDMVIADVEFNTGHIFQNMQSKAKGLSIRRKVIEFWVEFKPKQQAFFEYGIQQLSALVKKNRDLIRYTWELSDKKTISCYPGSVNQTDYNKHFQSLLQKEKKIKLQKEKKVKIKPSKNLFDKVKNSVQTVQMAYHAVTRNNTNDLIIKTCQKQIKTIPVPKRIENGNPFPGDPFPYEKMPRVTRWEVEGALHPEDFPDYDLPFFNEMQWWLKLIHNPHPFIDNFLSLGFEHQFYSEEKKEFQPCISILTEINFMNATYRGVIQYTFDKNKQYLYHKCFKHKIDDAQVNEKIKIMEYPILSAQVKKVQYGKTTVSTDDLGNITLHDRDVTIKLFKS